MHFKIIFIFRRKIRQFTGYRYLRRKSVIWVSKQSRQVVWGYGPPPPTGHTHCDQHYWLGLSFAIVLVGQAVRMKQHE